MRINAELVNESLFLIGFVMYNDYIMYKKFIPFAVANSAYEIDFDFLKSIGVKTVFLDIDNTLDSYKMRTPTDKAREFVNKVKSEFNVVLISNNHKDKVTEYATSLNVDFIYKAYKPLPKKINRFISEHSLNKNDIILIGDQMMTDVWCASNVGIRVIMTNKLVKEDQWTTHINRIFERIIKKYHVRHNNLRDWRELYGKM